ncbi:MAG: helix-turn-helix transcriptional regulator [Actinomycetota bacterium]
MSPTPVTTTEARFARLLIMVPFVLRNSGISVDEVCGRFGLTQKELIADLNLLFMCGLPGYGPGDLIEAYIDSGQVWIKTAEYFSRPLRLTPAEGLLLYAGARALAAAGGEPNPAILRATERLKDALGSEALERVAVGVAASDELTEIRRAIESGLRVHLRYQSHSKEEITERDVDPWALFFAAGRWYLLGWCNKVEAERIFRLDRVRRLQTLDERAIIPADVDLSKYEQIYVQSAGALPVTIDLRPEAAWVTEYYPTISVTPRKGGWTRVQLTAGGTIWLERLLVRLGKYARVIEPKSLAEAVRQSACRLAARYES